MEQPWPLAPWPDVATRVLAGRDDRLFPAAFQRRVARERPGINADEIEGGHLVALSHPQELADRLDIYRREAAKTASAQSRS
jgi:pimeloyl-ACP methyl ester carboxylesterase